MLMFPTCWIALFYVYKYATFLVGSITTDLFPKQMYHNLCRPLPWRSYWVQLHWNVNFCSIIRTELIPLIYGSHFRWFPLCLWASQSFLPPIIVVAEVPVVTWLIWEVSSVLLMSVKIPPVSLDRVHIWILSPWILIPIPGVVDSHRMDYVVSILLFHILSDISVLDWIVWLNLWVSQSLDEPPPLWENNILGFIYCLGWHAITSSNYNLTKCFSTMTLSTTTFSILSTSYTNYYTPPYPWNDYLVLHLFQY